MTPDEERELAAVRAALEALGNVCDEEFDRAYLADLRRQAPTRSGEAPPATRESPPSPLLVILQDIAASLDLVAQTLVEINCRDSVWRRT